jgi:hypothetical protein
MATQSPGLKHFVLKSTAIKLYRHFSRAARRLPDRCFETLWELGL